MPEAQLGRRSLELGLMCDSALHYRRRCRHTLPGSSGADNHYLPNAFVAKLDAVALYHTQEERATQLLGPRDRLGGKTRPVPRGTRKSKQPCEYLLAFLP